MATYSGSRQQARRRRKRTSKQDAFSKKLIDDIRSLLWIVTVGGLLLAFYCVKRNYTGALPWIGQWLDCRGRHMAWYAHFI